MRVVVVGKVPHVVVDRPGGIDELVIRHFCQYLMKMSLHLLGRIGVVYSPDDHRHEADFTVADPTELVFEVSLGEDGRIAEFAAVAH